MSSNKPTTLLSVLYYDYQVNFAVVVPPFAFYLCCQTLHAEIVLKPQLICWPVLCMTTVLIANIKFVILKIACSFYTYNHLSRLTDNISHPVHFNWFDQVP